MHPVACCIISKRKPSKREINEILSGVESFFTDQGQAMPGKPGKMQ